MASASITRRRTRSGPRYVVRYRLGGRAYPIRHAGSFKTEREAKERLRKVSGELAAGRDPALALVAERSRPSEPLHAIADRFEASRVHLSVNGRKNIASHMPRILATFADRDPQTFTFGEIQDWIAANTKAPENNAGLEPSSLSRYFATLRQLLDFAGLDPNPARDRRVKLPAIVSDEPDPPTQPISRIQSGRPWLKMGRGATRSPF